MHTSHLLDEKTGLQCFFKCELFQRTGSFKFRVRLGLPVVHDNALTHAHYRMCFSTDLAVRTQGACNAVLALPEDAAVQGVVTHSSGNHAAALALAAKVRWAE